MDDETQKETSTVEVTEGETSAPSQDPVQAELEKEQRKGGKSEAEKAAFSLKKNAERLMELGGDPSAVLGIKVDPVSDDDAAPVTVGMLKKIEAEKAQRSALQLADEVQDPHERELTKRYLESTIVPSGDPQGDFRKALALTHSVKNGQIAEEIVRRGPGSHSTSSGAPAKSPEGEFVPTAEEEGFMKTFKLSKDQIIAARKANEQ